MAKEDMKEVDAYISVDDVKRRGDYVRQYIQDKAQIDVADTAPNRFNYALHTNSIGLNEISNVDMGYAGTTIGKDKVGKRQPYLNELEYNVKLMEDSPNSILVLNGGLFTYVPKSRNGELLSYSDQIAYFYSLFKNLAKDGKIVAMVRGTEEHRILRNHGIDVYGILQEALGLSNKVCNDALINVAIDDDIVENANVGIRTINWNNTATTTAYIGRKMEERATKRGGADIYLARTTKNFFKTAVIGESKDGKIEKKPIYLISPGPYTPFKGALTAGAEYNSIKDGELAPNSFWYKVTVEERKDKSSARPYIVRVNPIEYVAHQVTEYSTDKTVASIENLVANQSDDFIRYLLDKYQLEVAASRDENMKQIRDTLINNKSVAERNAEIAKFTRLKNGEVVTDTKDQLIEDLGTNIDTYSEPNIIIDGQDDCLENA